MAIRTADPADVDEALAEFQGQLNLMFAKARTLWKESAARVHPELQPSGYKLLTFVARSGGTNAHQLAECFEMDKSVVSRQVRMLEDLGLLESRADEHDGRLRVLTATPEATAALAQVRADHAQRMRAAMIELDPGEIEVASKVFRILAEA
ncbi:MULTISPECIES: MarR family winged helix-turn-helix transcriptional regulator [unclassified Microbacterium]|uniref:MarR family winged helix-turn-helix transcriptional regulator n=1 Tax=unclassified Microbacterium TaxID=2609290 RepID=UPI0012FAAFE1|nr:MarR family transcriptional regulator [Microbacterium sp. MAH-37]MVQ43436.1 MarR family transcriptional regulator [Microbacterium sp. MAH-37]